MGLVSPPVCLLNKLVQDCKKKVDVVYAIIRLVTQELHSWKNLLRFLTTLDKTNK